MLYYVLFPTYVVHIPAGGNAGGGGATGGQAGIPGSAGRVWVTWFSGRLDHLFVGKDQWAEAFPCLLHASLFYTSGHESLLFKVHDLCPGNGIYEGVYFEHLLLYTCWCGQ